MSTARFIGVCLVLGVTYVMAANLSIALHEVFVPAWPGWVCLVVGVGATLAMMWFIATGIGHFFFEGVVICVICGSLMAGMASMSVNAKVQHLERIQQKHLHQQQAKLENDRINKEKAERKRLWDLRKAQQN